MAYTQADVIAIEEAIRALITGTRTVSLSMGDKSIRFTEAELPRLQQLRDSIKTELALASGTVNRRTYAKHGGR